MAIREVCRNVGVFRIYKALAARMIIATMFTLTATARAATITVDSLADTGASGVCVLRDAITAANTMTATNGCTAGTGNDTIQFSVTGTIMLGSSLPKVTDSLLTIDGPALPGVTIDGGDKVQVMTVAERAELNLNDLTIANGSGGPGAGILNHGALSITNGTFPSNGIYFPRTYGGGAIANLGTLTVTNSTFSGNFARYAGSGVYGAGSVTNCTFYGNMGTRSGDVIDA